MAYTSFDPYRQQQIAVYDNDSDTDLERKVQSVGESWKEWRRTPLSIRSGLFVRLAELIEERKQSHAELIVNEMGKPITQALAEIEKCALLCRYYADMLGDFLKSDERTSSANSGYVNYDSQGIILGVMPWNFPWWQVFRFFVPALAGGNGAILKHASNVTGCALMMERAVREAGFPENIFRVVMPEHSQIEKLIGHPSIRGVALTGSNHAGSVVASLAGKYIKKSVLELGGSDPFIVFPDADLSAAVEAAVKGRYLNCGQSCIAAKRFIVHESLYKEFTERFSEAVKGFIKGNPLDSSVFIGPMVNSKSVSEIALQVKKSVSMGARILYGGTKGSDGPAFYEPTVVIDIPKGTPLENEEVFGPVAPVFPFRSVTEAVSRANNSRFGLGASVWTADKELAMKVAGELDTGTVAVNGFTRSDPSLPFGGVKESGYGRELSLEGIREFMNIKSIAFYK